MKFIVCSDIHFHNWPQHSTIKNGINSRLEDAMAAFVQMCSYARTNDIKLIVFCGDLFHVPKKIYIDVYSSVFSLIAKYDDLTFIMIPGNHDQVDEGGHIHSLLPFQYLSNVIVLNESFTSFSDCLFWGVPYSESVELTRERLGYAKHWAEVEAPVKAKKYLLFHHSVDGAMVGPADYRLKSDLKKEDLNVPFDYIFAGHYHIHQHIGGMPNAVYVGSLLQHDLGDRGHSKGFLVFDSDANTFERVRTSAPEFVVISPRDTIDPSNKFITIAYKKDDDQTDLVEFTKELKTMGALSVSAILVKDKEELEFKICTQDKLEIIDPITVLEDYVVQMYSGKIDKETVTSVGIGLYQGEEA